MLETTVDMRIFEHSRLLGLTAARLNELAVNGLLFLYALSGFGVAGYF